ncbi:uncharacterized protein BCR38DRAFT_446375 [Pseudomassariella vexata]|uniref:Secreted protein n=1 Tax=Pseudomassariella vexata TaxID=1141098 RepID=A0A1Y2DHJ3_9PEZI|nr:uncharacterized protein BCR38DRAFT_446375 [Pseudomassariella vexata]ORY58717.1 hypothetical protein BCR38DRAFT_446375 [Pseudomassariella vexata]
MMIAILNLLEIAIVCNFSFSSCLPGHQLHRNVQRGSAADARPHVHVSFEAPQPIPSCRLPVITCWKKQSDPLSRLNVGASFVVFWNLRLLLGGRLPKDQRCNAACLLFSL